MAPLATKIEVAEKNKINAFLPVRNKSNKFEWETITGMVLADALGKSVGRYTLADYEAECRKRLTDLMEPPEFWDVVARMYFESRDVYRIAPEFLIFKASDTSEEGGRPNDRMADLFRALLEDRRIEAEFEDDLTFLESKLLRVLRQQLQERPQEMEREEPYLPFLAKAFQADLEFLFDHPKYLLQELTNTLRLYAFCYCTQLALNIRDWRSGEPRSKPLYFILDTEKAGTERASKRCGFESFRSASAYLFPYLSALEALQGRDSKRPLWKLYQEARGHEDQKGLVRTLTDYASAFASSRNLEIKAAAKDLEGAFALVLDLAFTQFKSGTTRHGINQKYVKEVLEQICLEFVQNRGRAGRMLVLNQDRMLLLTNLAIGNQDRLRLHELLEEFKRRGVYLDNQSVLALVAFYERLGNVERMSDSGDAIYVRKTLR